MREQFPHKKPGDSLSADQVNKQSRVARATGTPQPGGFMHGRPGATLQDPPFFMTTAEITEDKDAPIYEIRERYYDDDVENPDDAQWRTDDESETTAPWDLDATEPSELSFSKGDVLTAWWHPQRGMFLPLTAGVSGAQGTIRFSILEACCEECWADVFILSRPPGVSKIIGEGAVESECGDVGESSSSTSSSGESSSSSSISTSSSSPSGSTSSSSSSTSSTSSSGKGLTTCQVRIYDKAGCFLTEANEQLVGRVGYATYLEDSGCGGTDPCPDIPGAAWEIISLCCPDDFCAAAVPGCT